MFRHLVKCLRIVTFTLAPAVAGWFLVYVVHHPWVNHSNMSFSPIINWIIFLVASTITITGYVLDIRAYCKSKHVRSQVRTYDRRTDPTRQNTGRRTTDIQN